MTGRSIRTVSDNPGLAPVVATWIVAAFFDHPDGYTVEGMTALILSPAAGLKETFVLFDDDQPVGTAALVPADLDSRPDLTPWLAGVFVEPAFRGRGHATALIRRVEAFAAEASVPVLWLYTACIASASAAEPLRTRDAEADLADIYSDAVMTHVDAVGEKLPSTNSQPSYVLWLLPPVRLPGSRADSAKKKVAASALGRVVCSGSVKETLPPQDIRAALSALSGEDLLRLRAIARLRARSLPGDVSWSDLVVADNIF